MRTTLILTSSLDCFQVNGFEIESFAAGAGKVFIIMMTNHQRHHFHHNQHCQCYRYHQKTLLIITEIIVIMFLLIIITIMFLFLYHHNHVRLKVIRNAFSSSNFSNKTQQALGLEIKTAFTFFSHIKAKFKKIPNYRLQLQNESFQGLYPYKAALTLHS